jgi:hypothetical protein
MGTKIDAGAVAQPFRNDVKAAVERLKASGIGKINRIFNFQWL